MKTRMHTSSRHYFWAAVAVALGCSGLARATDLLSPCDLPGVRRPAKCGVFEVPENWDKPAGRKLSLAVTVIPAEVAGSNKDPIVPLMGGPGEAAIPAAEYFIGQFAAVLRGYCRCSESLPDGPRHF
jgi:hypothetical protein